MLQMRFPETHGGAAVPDLFYMIVFTTERVPTANGGLIADMDLH